MKKARFSETQIVTILKNVVPCVKVGETCRKLGVSEPTNDSQYSGMMVSQLSPLYELQDENARLKRIPSTV